MRRDLRAPQAGALYAALVVALAMALCYPLARLYWFESHELFDYVSRTVEYADALRQQQAPDFLLVHPMNLDDAGHKHGLDSPQYRNSARRADVLLAEYIQTWLDAGYQILVTADHGMNLDRSHNGLLAEEREVPLLVLGSAFSLDAQAQPKQTELCGTVCELLGVPHDKPLCRELLK
jgi:predicted AlkP superfamily pyrophosphatase or phosphodiesterase